MNDFTLHFTLRQHTPLIHFQHDQAGATLRATEVKARLDRFLIEKLFQNQFDQCKKHLIGYDENKPNELQPRFNEGYRALNYKLRIQPTAVRTSEIGFPRNSRDGAKPDAGFPCFFANMGDENRQNPKGFSFCDDVIPCTIQSMDTDLITLFKTSKGQLATFFLYENFGTRNGKGFGSFSLESFESAPANFKHHASIKWFSVPVKTGSNPDFKSVFQGMKYTDKSQVEWLVAQQNLFNHIDLFYRTLRSGINIPNKLYFKSLMFHYAKKDNWQWDKKTLRLHFYKDHPAFKAVVYNRQSPEGTVVYQPNSVGRDIHDFRDLLGLSTEQQWKSYGDSTKKSGKTAAGDDVDRMKSPILFKPIRKGNEFHVFIISKPIPEGYGGATITTESNKSGTKKDLQIPEGFLVANYLNWAIQFYKEQTETNQNFFVEFDREPQELTIIENIYNQLIEQIQ